MKGGTMGMAFYWAFMQFLPNGYSSESALRVDRRNPKGFKMMGHRRPVFRGEGLGWVPASSRKEGFRNERSLDAPQRNRSPKCSTPIVSWNFGKVGACSRQNRGLRVMIGRLSDYHVHGQVL